MDPTDPDADLRELLATLTPSARDHLRRVLVMDQADRDVVSAEPMRFRDANGDGWSDVIDTLTMYPELRRQVVRLLAEIDAGANGGYMITDPNMNIPVTGFRYDMDLGEVEEWLKS